MVIKKWKVFNESLMTSLSVGDMINYLRNVKNDKIANILARLKGTNIYSDDEDMNYIGTTNDLLISFLPNNRRNGIYNDTNSRYNSIMADPRRMSVRVGRAVRKIIDAVKNNLSFKGKCKGKIVKPTNEYYIFLYVNQEIILINSENNQLKISFRYDNKDITIYNKKTSITSGNNNSLIYFVDTDCVFKCSDESFSMSDFKASLKPLDWTAPICWDYYNEVNVQEMDIDVNIICEEVNDHDIEVFSNEFVSLMKSSKSDESSKIEVVTGDDIIKWYNKKNYQSNIGRLGNSCMSGETYDIFLSMYASCPDRINLLILKNKENKLVGRALLWKLDDGNMFMDRIYTANDSDDNIFINYAIANDYIYRNIPIRATYYRNGKEIPEPEMYFTLTQSEYENYPYVDTLKYMKDNVLSNIKNTPCYLLNDVNGTREKIFY